MGIDGSDIKRRNNELKARAERAGQEPVNANLITCDACGRELSRTAPACPHCGDPRTKYNNDIKKQSAKETRTGCLVMLAFLGIIILWNINDSDKTDLQAKKQIEAAPDPAIEARIKDENWKYFCQEEITKRLKDPESAKFQEVFISRKSGEPIVCGQVNGKNGFGGYSGFERFISAGKLFNILESDMAEGEMDKSWLEFCGQ